ncbi:MAG: DUF192 domain-containing protein, partial [Bdellovibrionales bacterium]|nr:DUF192 domain-containing protein [Bdellovibrionales bacterium]
MAKLINQSKNIELSHNVIEAKTFYQRLKGLLGRDGLPVRECLLFRRTNSIHTFMMKFNLDVIFLDRKDRVKSIHLNVKPGRIILPIWGAW